MIRGLADARMNGEQLARKWTQGTVLSHLTCLNLVAKSHESKTRIAVVGGFSGYTAVIANELLNEW